MSAEAARGREGDAVRGPPGAEAAHAAHPHGTRRGYLIGFGASVALTAIPFWLVMTGAAGGPIAATIAVMVLAAAQIVVHMVYFLHMNTRSEGGWTFISLVFTVTLVGIALAGSIWVMHHMDHNMMPMAPHEARSQP